MLPNATNRLNKIKQELTAEKLTTVAYEAFVKNTPIRTGNARKNTNKGNSEIKANYNYATRLNAGASRQSPDGMVNPTIKALRAYINKQLGR